MNLLLEGRGDHIEVEVEGLQELRNLNSALSDYENILQHQEEQSKDTKLEQVRSLRSHIVDDMVDTFEGKRPDDAKYNYTVEEEDIILNALSAAAAREKQLEGQVNDWYEPSRPSNSEGSGEYEWLYNTSTPIKVAKAARFITYESDKIAKEYNFDK